MKKLFVVFLFLVLSILSGCKGKTDIDDSLIEKIALFNLESNYSEMYEEYKIIVEHSKEHNCDILNEYEFKNLQRQQYRLG